MTNIIKHRGIVESIDGSLISVKIMQASACATCSVRGHCGAADNQEKIIKIQDSTYPYKVGEEVMVYGTVSMGMKAVLIAFTVPFLILIILLFITMDVTDNNEMLAAVVSLTGLIPYYVVVYLFRNKLKKSFSFTLKPIK